MLCPSPGGCRRVSWTGGERARGPLFHSSVSECFAWGFENVLGWSVGHTLAEEPKRVSILPERSGTMNSVAIEIEMDFPDGVAVRGYERHQGAHVFEVAFELPERCVCPKCRHEAAAQLREKDEVLAIRDLDLMRADILDLSAVLASMSQVPAADAGRDAVQASARDLHLSFRAIRARATGGRRASRGSKGDASRC